MITILRLTGVFLLMLVGYHYINDSLGFSVAGSIATAIFAVCLIELYQNYRPDRGNWVGWGLISAGCLLVSLFTQLSWLLIVPVVMVITGYRMAALPFDMSYANGGDAGDGGSFDSFDGGDGGGD